MRTFFKIRGGLVPQLLVSAVTVLCTVTMGVGVAGTHNQLVQESNRAWSAASADFHGSRIAATQSIDTANSALTAAQKTVTDSQGKVLQEDTRTALSALITADRSKVTAAKKALASNADAASREPHMSYFGTEVEDAAKQVTAITYPKAAALAAIAPRLTKAERAVTTAVAAWTAEQQRIAAQKAAEEAARQAVVQKSAQQAAAAAERVTPAVTARTVATAAAPAVSAGAAPAYQEYVWAAGWQPQIDACRGAVDITAVYGVPTIAEHSNCGGYRFPKTAGAIVHLSGVVNGTYRVDGVVAHLDGNTQNASDLPRGYDLLYQTCVTGYTNMSFTGLTRIS